uniref:Nucleolar complex protein 4 homolog B n=1 Tax=Tanacetum cinerariifolium TaxID=118510 RepID=A0A6L2JTZ6_TANCI|nr:nucleolar complex protein 4 homolog B [Tanacetum cinerariifolium]
MSFLALPLPIDVYKELLDSCLKSPLLPAYLVASFAKKLSRLALTVPPSGSLVIEDNVETAKDVSFIKSGINQFKNDETDLLKTNAMSKFKYSQLRGGNVKHESHLLKASSFRSDANELATSASSLTGDSIHAVVRPKRMDL